MASGSRGTSEAFVALATDLFPLVSDGENPDEAYREVLGSGAVYLNSSVFLWGEMTFQRRATVADFVAHQHTLSHLDPQSVPAA